MITIKPYGGLANRMRAINSALLIAKSTGKKISVIWEMSFELNCSFHKLFCPLYTGNIHEYSINGFHKRSYDFLNRNLRKFGINLPFGFDLYLFDDDILDMKGRKIDFNLIIASKKSVFIRTVHQFQHGDDSFKAFIPIPELQNTIDFYVQGFSSNTIGVHIRRKDNIQSIKHSPLEGFIDFMKHEISERPETSFFLATDSEDVEETLMDIFKERIMTHKKSLDRNSEDGMQDALIDLYCLSKTIKIIGSYYSSFSEVAAQINNIEFIQVFQTK